MSLYLQIEIDERLYLLDTAIVTQIRAYAGGAVLLHGIEIPILDLQALFEGRKTQAGCCVIIGSDNESGGVALIAGRAETLVEMSDDEFKPLPPIGPLGTLIDAISVRSDTTTPALRLRGERAWAWCAGKRDSVVG